MSGHDDDALLFAGQRDREHERAKRLAREVMRLREYISGFGEPNKAAELREALDQGLDLIQRLQRALMFWLTAPPESERDTEHGKRFADDCYLLFGYQGDLQEPGAQALGWVTASAWRDLALHACDNLNDMPISEKWAQSYCEQVEALLKQEPPDER